jgi:uncharacterized protein with PIN domain
MADREKVIKVIKGLEEAKEFIRTRSNGSASKICRLMDVCNAAIILLKEQEAIEPEVDVLNEIDRLYRCPKCHKHFFYRKQKYCDQCGQAVKWDD